MRMKNKKRLLAAAVAVAVFTNMGYMSDITHTATMDKSTAAAHTRKRVSGKWQAAEKLKFIFYC